MAHSNTPEARTVADHMRADWNERARRDANYYVAFGRREQDDSEFFSTAADVVRDLEGELKRLPAAAAAHGRALEIGCGPGRIIRPMSRHFGEIHGVDISDEMISQAQHRLRDISNARLHVTGGSDLVMFPGSHFDFVYSYAVFQHIPSADVVFSYLREIVRVLKPGGFARLQINGLPKTARAYTTWEGVRISGEEIKSFTREQGVLLLSLTGVDTQYMWTTWQKPVASSAPPRAGNCRVRSVSNALTGEQAVPQSGLLACTAFCMENLPEAVDLNSLEAFIGSDPGVCCYVGRPVNGLSQVNIFLPPGVRTGLLPVHFRWNDNQLCPDSTVRVIPPGPAVPRLIAVCDGVNLLSQQQIESGTIKATVEEVRSIDEFAATIDQVPVKNIETFRTDPLAERYEVNFHLPDGARPGAHVLEIRLGKRILTRMGIEVI